jgi:hypothetical protein
MTPLVTCAPNGHPTLHVQAGCPLCRYGQPGVRALRRFMSALLIILSLYSCAVILLGCRNGLDGNRR